MNQNEKNSENERPQPNTSVETDAFDELDASGNRIWMRRTLPENAMSDDVPDDHYQKARRDYLTSTELKTFLRCPAMVYDERMGIHARSPSRSMDLGTLVHAMVLEPQTFEEKYHVAAGPMNAKTGKPYGRDSDAYRTWANGLTKTIIRPEDYALAKQMEHGVLFNDVAAEIFELSEGFPESVLRAEYGGLACQIKMDWECEMNRTTIVDLKTCSDLDAFVKWDWKKFLYANQLAFYRSIYHEVYGKSQMFAGVDVLLVAVESQYPFRCGVFEIGDLELDDAEEENRKAIAELIQCIETNTWPTRFEKTRTLGRIRQQPVQEFDAFATNGPYADENTESNGNTEYETTL